MGIFTIDTRDIEAIYLNVATFIQWIVQHAGRPETQSMLFLAFNLKFYKYVLLRTGKSRCKEQR